jgi:hypothetical protein
MKTKIAGVSILIWAFGLCVITGAGLMAAPRIKEFMKPVPLEIVKKELWQNSRRYEARGQIYNPRKQPAKNVRVRFKVMESRLGAGDKIIKKQKGEAVDFFDYIPAGATVDFTAPCDVAVREYDVVELDEGKLEERE